jgi:hypothetical protein
MGVNNSTAMMGRDIKTSTVWFDWLNFSKDFNFGAEEYSKLFRKTQKRNGLQSLEQLESEFNKQFKRHYIIKTKLDVLIYKYTGFDVVKYICNSKNEAIKRGIAS